MKWSSKTTNCISVKTPKPLSVFELRHQKWSSYEPQNKKTSEHIC